jgi:purine-binding chemotaxis protein CheW
MAERNDLRTTASADVRRFLTFRAADKLYALPAEAVREIVLPVPMAKVPLSPKPLLGLANLRGVVLPVASLPLLLGRHGQLASPSQRVIVLEGRPAFGLLVDEVAALTPISAADIATEEAQISAESGEIVLGAFAVGGVDEVARILDIQALLSKALGVDTRRGQAAASNLHRQGRAASVVARQYETFITFEVAGQEFGLTLDSVREVLPSAEVSAPMPRAETAVLGLTALRSMLLPLLSMRALLGFPPDAGRRMTLVVSIAGVSVGLAVDSVRDIVRADASELEPVPAAIASRSQGEASVQSVLKIDGGARLIAILAPDRLFREDVMNRIKASVAATGPVTPASSVNGAERIFLVFSLGGQEFGLAISAVEEVARLPDEITRLPKAPDFLKGVVNLRGTVLPVIDQRQRFDFPASDAGEAKRLVVVRIGDTVAGFIVDGVSEVLRVASDAIDPPPDVVVPARVLEGVINLEAAGRMILLLDPSQLLSRAEQGLLDALGRVQEAQAAVDQGSDR